MLTVYLWYHADRLKFFNQVTLPTLYKVTSTTLYHRMATGKYLNDSSERTCYKKLFENKAELWSQKENIQKFKDQLSTEKSINSAYIYGNSQFWSLKRSSIWMVLMVSIVIGMILERNLSRYFGGGLLMVWGGFSMTDKTPLAKILSRMNSKKLK